MNCYRCNADCWDHAWFRKGSRPQEIEVIQCAFCGVLDFVPRGAAPTGASPQHFIAAPATSGEFVFDSGRFAGKTIREVVAHPQGCAYLAWARDRDPSWNVAIESFMNNAAPSA